MTNVVLIGGNGFVGRNLAYQLSQDPDNSIYLLDNLLSSDRELLDPCKNIKLIEGDARNIANITTLPSVVHQVYILNCLHGNQSSLFNPLSDLDNTLAPVIGTLEWVRRKHPSAKVVYAGAGCAVAEKTWGKATPVTESDEITLSHDSPYSISKLAGEMHAILYSKQFNLDVKRARFQNVYGPGEYLGAGKWRGTTATIWRNVIPTFIWKAISGDDLVVSGKHASRDFIYIDDITVGLEAIMQHGRSGEAYNLANGAETSIFDLANLIVQLCNSSSPIRVVDSRSWDNSGRRFGSTLKSSKELKFNPRYSIDAGLEKTIDWTIQNQNRIIKMIQRYSNYSDYFQ